MKALLFLRSATPSGLPQFTYGITHMHSLAVPLFKKPAIPSLCLRCFLFPFYLFFFSKRTLPPGFPHWYRSSARPNDSK